MSKQKDFQHCQQIYELGIELIELGRLSKDSKVSKEVVGKGLQLLQESTPVLSTKYFDEFCGTVPRRPLRWPWPFPWPISIWTNYNKPKPDPSPIKILGKFGILESLQNLQKEVFDGNIVADIQKLEKIVTTLES